LLRCGAAIHEINAVRAQLSQLKGGGLARLARPARVLALILTDVIGNRLDIIASGPTAPAASTPQDALAVIEKYDLRDHLPAAVLRHLESASSQDRPRASAPLGPLRHLESVPSVDPPPVENRLIASNRLACEAARLAARDLGFEAVFCGDDWQGEARRVGGRFAQIVMRSAREPGRPPALCFIAGGESTVAVRGPGKGGRNQEAALAAALAIAGAPNVVIAAFATDGVDGPTDAAGAVVTGDTIARARALGLDPKKHLDDNGSYPFFAALGDLIVTGPTGTNVNDLLFGLAY
jgi:hydroxypyruvate reductase